MAGGVNRIQRACKRTFEGVARFLGRALAVVYRVRDVLNACHHLKDICRESEQELVAVINGEGELSVRRRWTLLARIVECLGSTFEEFILRCFQPQSEEQRQKFRRFACKIEALGMAN